MVAPDALVEFKKAFPLAHVAQGLARLVQRKKAGLSWRNAREKSSSLMLISITLRLHSGKG